MYPRLRRLACRGCHRGRGSLVLKLVEELGFDGVDAGGLDESWRQQPGTPVYTKDFDADGVRRGSHEASKDRTAEWRGTSNSPGSFTAPA
jgi:8-hydroxy-5-deazaflavin:NADPH oxidoreductase